MTDLENELLAALKECGPCLGWWNLSKEKLLEEERLGNELAPILMRAKAAIEKAEAQS